MTPEQLEPIVHSELTWICVPYVTLCLVMIAIWIYFFRHPIVTSVETTAERAPLSTRIVHVGAAMLATALPFVAIGILFPQISQGQKPAPKLAQLGLQLEFIAKSFVAGKLHHGAERLQHEILMAVFRPYGLQLQGRALGDGINVLLV